MSTRSITVVGAGILGLWQALTLARRGHRVRLLDASPEPFAAGASRYAGVMLAPDCESAGDDLVRTLGREGLALWRATYPRIVNAGSLVVAPARDRAELARFAALTERPATIAAEGIAALEPDLAGRFEAALYYAEDAHMPALDALAFLLDAVRAAGVDVRLGETWHGEVDRDATIVDCRGFAARAELPALRGVRGERVVIETREIFFGRSVRLLHPRQPIYVVPWGDGRFLVGATVIESEDAGPITVRSALELLGSAFALHPAFGEAAIVETGAGVRPAFPDNIPRAILRDGGRRIMVNGAYRHGFLLAPVLAAAVADWLAAAARHPLLVQE